jgi:hypothetical protein
MFGVNFFGLILDGLTLIFGGAIRQMPDSSLLGIVPLIVGKVGISFAIFVSFVGSFVHLDVVFFVLRTVMAFEVIRIIFAAYNWLKKILPVPTG